MSSQYLNSLSQEDYKKLSLKLTEIQNYECFICGKK